MQTQDLIAELETIALATDRLLQYEGHHAWCGHGEDMNKPCVCGLLEAQNEARARITAHLRPVDPLVSTLRDGPVDPNALIRSLRGFGMSYAEVIERIQTGLERDEITFNDDAFVVLTATELRKRGIRKEVG